MRTLKFEGYSSTERGYLLSDILEDEVEQKYFLSREQIEKIAFH